MKILRPAESGDFHYGKMGNFTTPPPDFAVTGEMVTQVERMGLSQGVAGKGVAAIERTNIRG